MFFFQILKKVYKNYKEKLLCVVWFLTIISATGHNILKRKIKKNDS